MKNRNAEDSAESAPDTGEGVSHFATMRAQVMRPGRAIDIMALAR